MKMKRILFEAVETVAIGLASIFCWEFAKPYGVDKEVKHDKPQTVEQVQCGLVELGYLGESDIDGVCGSKTTKAWNQYSIEHDPKTLAEFERCN